jgi:hypothetical protein
VLPGCSSTWFLTKCAIDVHMPTRTRVLQVVVVVAVLLLLLLLLLRVADTVTAAIMWS